MSSTIPSAGCRRTFFISIWTSPGAARKLKLAAHSRVIAPIRRMHVAVMAPIWGARGVPLEGGGQSPFLEGDSPPPGRSQRGQSPSSRPVIPRREAMADARLDEARRPDQSAEVDAGLETQAV